MYTTTIEHFLITET